MRQTMMAMTVAVALAFAGTASAAVEHYGTKLAGSKEVPPTDSKGKGKVTATLDTKTKLFSYTVTYSDLSGPATMAHFHGPAWPGDQRAADHRGERIRGTPMKRIRGPSLTPRSPTCIAGRVVLQHPLRRRNKGGEIAASSRRQIVQTRRATAGSAMAWLRFRSVRLFAGPVLGALLGLTLLADPAASARPRSTFRDCDGCPVMTVVPAGDLMIGSPPREVGRDAGESLPHRMRIEHAFAVAIYDVTRSEFMQFADATGYAETAAHCDWRNPTFHGQSLGQGPDDPVDLSRRVIGHRLSKVLAPPVALIAA